MSSSPPKLERLRWIASRLRAMTPAELVERLREAREKARWKRRKPGWSDAVGDGPLAGCPELRTRLAAAAAFPAIRESARLTRSGCLRFFGRDWPIVEWQAGAGRRLWLRDPVTDRLWPGTEAGFSAVDLRGTGTDPAGARLGDAKFVWEPARLQMLHPLAALAADGDREAGETALAILRDFTATNPPYGGVHWSSGIEMALRLVALTLLVAALGPDGIPASDRAMIRRLAAAQAAYLRAFPSLHSSANNHRVAEGLGLQLAGRLVPDLGAVWEAEGRAILEEMAPRLILADGGGAEQALVYQAFTMEMLAFAALVAGADGRPLAAAVTERLADGAAFLRAMLDGAGLAPEIGDDDETRVLAQPPDREPRYVASIVAAIAGLTGRADLLPPARDPHLRDALFAVPRPIEASVPDAAALATFPEAGYTILRETIAGHAVHLVFDHGPLGHAPLAAHGHADALALWLSLDGRRVLVDAGTYLYHAGGPARLRLRESPSHNTLAVRGASHSVAASAFSWSNRAETRLVTCTSGPDWSVAGAHDGYRRRYGVAHRRRLARIADGIAIGDALVGAAAPLPVDIRFLLPADLALVAAGEGVSVCAAGRRLCRLLPPEGFAVTIHRGAAEGAVRSTGFGSLEDAQRIVVSGTLGEREALTRILFG